MAKDAKPRSILRSLSPILTLATAAIVLAACGRSDAPECSAPDVESLVAKIIFDSVPVGTYSGFAKSNTWYIVRSNHDGTATVITADVNNLIKGIGLHFDSERERSYQSDVRKRFCTIDVKGAIDEANISAAISIRSEATFVRKTDGIYDGVFPSLNKDRYSLSADLSNGRAIQLSSADSQAAMKTFENQAMSVLQSLTWSDPQNYSVQITDKGDLYVSLNE